MDVIEDATFEELDSRILRLNGAVGRTAILKAADFQIEPSNFTGRRRGPWRPTGPCAIMASRIFVFA